MKFLLAATAVAALGATLASAPAGARTTSSMSAMPTCAAGDKVVWVNTRSKVFYEPGASHYGKTRHGKYVCESQATSMGMHMAKGGMMSDSNGAMMHHGMMKNHDRMMNDSSMGGSSSSGSMKSGSTGADSTKPGSMGPGSTGSGMTGAGTSGTKTQATSPSGGAITPAPTVSASPSN